MKPYYVLLLSLLLANPLFAQKQIHTDRVSIRAGVDLTSLDAPDDVAPRYVGRLAYHFAQDRIVAAAELGYLKHSSPNLPFNDADPGPNHRQRLTADLTVFYDLIGHPRHALRIGAGLSGWGRSDDLFRGARMNDGRVIVVERQQTTALNFGSHLATEYEWLFTQYWAVDVRLRMANLRGAGISSSLGLGISCRF